MKIVMKLFLALLASTTLLAACPTCVGRVTKTSKPFFSDEFYKNEHKSMDHLYQAINETKPKNEKKDTQSSSQQVATNSATPSPVPTNKERQ